MVAVKIRNNKTENKPSHSLLRNQKGNLNSRSNKRTKECGESSGNLPTLNLN